MVVSTVNLAVGQTIVTTLSQLNVGVGKVGLIHLLHEKKRSTQMKAIIIGTVLLLMLIGSRYFFAKKE